MVGIDTLTLQIFLPIPPKKCHPEMLWEQLWTFTDFQPFDQCSGPFSGCQAPGGFSHLGHCHSNCTLKHCHTNFGQSLFKEISNYKLLNISIWMFAIKTVTAVSYNRILPLANYCKSEDIFFKSDTKYYLQGNSTNLHTEDKQICIKVSTSYIGRTICFRYQC